MTQSRDGFVQQTFDAMRHAVAFFEEKNELPTILLCGKTGAGKSSLMNALVGGAVQEVGVTPTTQKPHSELLDEEDLKLRVIDTAGFAESGRHEERLDVLFSQLPQAHLLLLVVGYPDRGLHFEQEFLARLERRTKASYNIPSLVALSKIDLAPPVREWDPINFQLATPNTPKEKAVATWASYVQGTLNVTSERVVPCAVGESWDDQANQYGVQELQMVIYELLPEAAKTYYARVVHNEAVRERRAQAIIATASLAASAAGAQPIPTIPDAALITPVQIGMIVALARLHGGDPTQIDASRLLGPVLSKMGGKLLFQQVLKFLPGLGSVLGASVAGLLTLSLGQTYHYLMKRGIWEPGREELLQIFGGFWDKNKNLEFADLTKSK